MSGEATSMGQQLQRAGNYSTFLVIPIHKHLTAIAGIFLISYSTAIRQRWVCIITNAMIKIVIIFISNTIAAETGIAPIVAG